MVDALTSSQRREQNSDVYSSCMEDDSEEGSIVSRGTTFYDICGSENKQTSCEGDSLKKDSPFLGVQHLFSQSSLGKVLTSSPTSSTKYIVDCESDRSAVDADDEDVDRDDYEDDDDDDDDDDDKWPQITLINENQRRKRASPPLIASRNRHLLRSKKLSLSSLKLNVDCAEIKKSVIENDEENDDDDDDDDYDEEEAEKIDMSKIHGSHESRREKVNEAPRQNDEQSSAIITHRGRRFRRMTTTAAACQADQSSVDGRLNKSVPYDHFPRGAASWPASLESFKARFPPKPPAIDVISPSPTLSFQSFQNPASLHHNNPSWLSPMSSQYLAQSSVSSGTSSSGTLSPALTPYRSASSRSNSSDGSSPLPPLKRTPKLWRRNLLPPIVMPGNKSPHQILSPQKDVSSPVLHCVSPPSSYTAAESEASFNDICKPLLSKYLEQSLPVPPSSDRQRKKAIVDPGDASAETPPLNAKNATVSSPEKRRRKTTKKRRSSRRRASSDGTSFRKNTTQVRDIHPHTLPDSSASSSSKCEDRQTSAGSSLEAAPPTPDPFESYDCSFYKPQKQRPNRVTLPNISLSSQDNAASCTKRRMGVVDNTEPRKQSPQQQKQLQQHQQHQEMETPSCDYSQADRLMVTGRASAHVKRKDQSRQYFRDHIRRNAESDVDPAGVAIRENTQSWKGVLRTRRFASCVENDPDLQKISIKALNAKHHSQ